MVGGGEGRVDGARGDVGVDQVLLVVVLYLQEGADEGPELPDRSREDSDVYPVPQPHSARPYRIDDAQVDVCLDEHLERGETKGEWLGIVEVPDLERVPHVGERRREGVWGLGGARDGRPCCSGRVEGRSVVHLEQMDDGFCHAVLNVTPHIPNNIELGHEVGPFLDNEEFSEAAPGEELCQVCEVRGEGDGALPHFVIVVSEGRDGVSFLD